LNLGQSYTSGNKRGGIVVRAHASRVEGLRFEPDSMPWMIARLLFTQQQMGDKGGEGRNWPPYLTCRWLRISVLSNRHFPMYEGIWHYLFLHAHLVSFLLIIRNYLACSIFCPVARNQVAWLYEMSFLVAGQYCIVPSLIC